MKRRPKVRSTQITLLRSIRRPTARPGQLIVDKKTKARSKRVKRVAAEPVEPVQLSSQFNTL